MNAGDKTRVLMFLRFRVDPKMGPLGKSVWSLAGFCSTMATALEGLVTFDFWQNFCKIKESTATVKPNAAMESNKCWRQVDRGRTIRGVVFLTALMDALWEKDRVFAN
jgi:hypothetical protein